MESFESTSGFDKADGRKPDLVCIGAQKAGTSWLQAVLAEHPDVWVPPFKEIHFFDHKFIEECRNWTPWHIRKCVKEVREAHIAQHAFSDRDFLAYLDAIETTPMFNGNWYKGIFSRAPKASICVDVTPEYSCLPEEGVQFVKKFLNKTKFIYIIRDPADRIISQLRMFVSRQKKSPKNYEDWASILERSIFDTRGDYQQYVPRWKANFASDRLLFVPYGMLRKDPRRIIKQVEDFANLSNHDRYQKEHKIIHGRYPVTVPDYVVEHVKEKSRLQNEFLLSEFGSEFAAQIK